MSELVDRLRKAFDAGVPLRLSKDGGRAEVDPVCNEAANRIVVLESACKFSEREANELRAECDRLRELLANIYDNLNDMPISEEWAGKTCDRIDAALRGEGEK